MNFYLEPVKRDGHGKNISDYQIRDFYEKIAEELLEAHEAAICNDNEQEIAELIDVMTVCTTRIKSLNVSDFVIKDIQLKIIERNRKRGYFEESTHHDKPDAQS